MTRSVSLRARVWLALACLLLVPRAHADIDIDVRGVDDELRSNVLLFLSLSRYKDRTPDGPTLERLQGRVEREVKDALRPFGYYEPRVQTQLTTRSPGSWHAQIDIDPGPPVVLETVEVRVLGPGAADPRLARIVSGTRLRQGGVLRHATYEQTKLDLQRTAAAYGYLDARLTRNELQVDPPRHRASAFLTLESGERYRFGATTIDQSVIRDALVRRYLRYHEDDPFDATLMLATQFALDDSQYFSTVAVEPGTPDRVLHRVPILIRAERNRRDRYAVSGGYGTDTGPRGTLQWDRRWISPRGDRFTVQIEASARLQVLQSFYTIPIGDPALEKLAIGAAADYSTPGSLTNKDLSFGPSLTRVDSPWQYVLALTPTYAVTSDANGTRHDTLVIPSITLGSVPRGYLGEPLFTRDLIIQLRGGTPLLGSANRFLQAHIQAQRTLRLSDHWHLLLRGEAGTTLVSNLADLPGFLRFFAGGEGSVRGFAWDDLSPVTPQLTPAGTPVIDPASGKPVLLKVGGRHVLTGSTELERDLPRNFGIAVFTDFGNAFDVFGRSPNPTYPHFIEYSAGIGVRWRLPVVTLGVDVAQPLSRPGAGPRFDLNFSPRL